MASVRGAAGGGLSPGEAHAACVGVSGYARLTLAGDDCIGPPSGPWTTTGAHHRHRT